MSLPPQTELHGFIEPPGIGRVFQQNIDCLHNPIKHVEDTFEKPKETNSTRTNIKTAQIPPKN